jgi:hypothetical protein
LNELLDIAFRELLEVTFREQGFVITNDEASDLSDLSKVSWGGNLLNASEDGLEPVTFRELVSATTGFEVNL